MSSKDNQAGKELPFSLHVKQLLTILTIFIIITAGQAFFTWKSLNDEQANRKRMEINVANERVNYLKKNVTDIISNVAPSFEHELDNPNALSPMLMKLMAGNTQLLGAAVAYKTDYLPDKGKLFAPYAYRQAGVVHKKLMIRDYTTAEWYEKAINHHETGWSSTYVDEEGMAQLMQTFYKPLRDSTGQVAAVLTASLPMADVIQQANNVYTKASRRGIFILLLQMVGIMLLGFVTWRVASNLRKSIGVAREKDRISNELSLTSDMQQAILPKKKLQHSNLKMAAMLQPAKEMGGDFYDYSLRGDRLFFCIGDVAQKGVGASLAMVTTRTVYRIVIDYESSPARIVEAMNHTLVKINEQQMFATIFVGILNLETGLLSYCNASHMVPMVIGPNGVGKLDVKPNVPIGISDWTFEEQQLQLEPGTTLFLYNDGVVETPRQQGEFGEKRLMLYLKSESEANDEPDKILKKISSALKRHIGDETVLPDDITMMAIRYK